MSKRNRPTKSRGLLIGAITLHLRDVITAPLLEFNWHAERVRHKPLMIPCLICLAVSTKSPPASADKPVIVHPRWHEVIATIAQDG